MRRVLAAFAILTALAACASVNTPSPDPGGNIVALTAVDKDHLVGVGTTAFSSGNLIIARSDDAGATWLRTVRPGPPLSAVAAAGDRLFGSTDCVNQNGNGRPVAGPCLFVSADRGLTWTATATDGLVDPSFADAVHGWSHRPVDAGLEPPYPLFATDDSGDTWHELMTPCNADAPWIARAVLVTPSDGYVICRGMPGTGSEYPWHLVRVAGDATSIIQSGITGTPNSLFAGDDPRALMMAADGTGYVLTHTIYRTTDGGRTWPERGTPETIGGFQSGTLVSDTTAYVALSALGNYTRVYSTSNGGTSWAMRASWPFVW